MTTAAAAYIADDRRRAYQGAARQARLARFAHFVRRCCEELCGRR